MKDERAKLAQPQQSLSRFFTSFSCKFNVSTRSQNGRCRVLVVPNVRGQYHTQGNSGVTGQYCVLGNLCVPRPDDPRGAHYIHRHRSFTHCYSLTCVERKIQNNVLSKVSFWWRWLFKSSVDVCSPLGQRLPLWLISQTCGSDIRLWNVRSILRRNDCCFY